MSRSNTVSPTITRKGGINLAEDDFAFSSPVGATGSGSGGRTGAGAGAGAGPAEDVLQSVQRELLMLRHQLSPSDSATGRKGARGGGKGVSHACHPHVSPKKPAALFGSVLEHKQQKITLQPRLGGEAGGLRDRDRDVNLLGGGGMLSTREVKNFIGNIGTLISCTDPSLSQKFALIDVEREGNLVSAMHDTVVTVRELCRIFCKQRTQLAQLVSQKSEVNRVLSAATELSHDRLLQEVAAYKDRVNQLEEELQQATSKQLELEGELQLCAPQLIRSQVNMNANHHHQNHHQNHPAGAGMGGDTHVHGRGQVRIEAGSTLDQQNLQGPVTSSQHPAVSLETLLQAQANQSQQLMEVLETVKRNQAEIAAMKTERQSSGGKASTDQIQRRVSTSKRSSKIESLRKAALATDSEEEESFDKDDSSESDQDEVSRSEGGDKFMDIVNAARGSNSNSSWGKIKGRMPQIRRRHGIHASISVPASTTPSDSIGRRSVSGARQSMFPKDSVQYSKKGSVPSHMMNFDDLQ